jgi:glycosyltransferase involved in cell wall biosynthesis
LIQACARLKARGCDFRCEIAGGGELANNLQALINELGVADRVTLLGPQPQEQIRRKLHCAAALAAPCVIAADEDRDGLPTILLESMAMGTPCISTDVTGIPEVLRDGQTGLQVPQHDADQLADACESLLRDPDLRVRLATEARKLIEERFDSTLNAAAIRDLVSSVTAGAGTG